MADNNNVDSESKKKEEQLKKAVEIHEKVKHEFAANATKAAHAKPGVKKNPFVYESRLWTPRQTFLVLCGIIVVPLRLFLTFLLVMINLVFVNLAISGDFKVDEPMAWWRKLLLSPCVYIVRLEMYVLGFYWVETIGKPCKPSEASVIVCAPHSSVYDTLFITYSFSLPSSISKAENLHLPLAGAAFKAMQAITVDREDKDNKNAALNKLVARAQSKSFGRQIMIFCEGTCTNRSALIMFKKGAFAAGVPVQPVSLEWGPVWSGFDFTWTAGGPSRLALFFHALCQPAVHLKVKFHPVYTPSEEEKQDWKLFANNVRGQMAEYLRIPVTAHSYEDMFLAKEAKKLNVPPGNKMTFEMAELNALFDIDVNDAKDLLRRYASVLKKGDKISAQDLAKILGLPYTEPVRDLFQMLKDDEHEDTIDFQSLLIGITNLSRAINESNVDESIELIWSAVSEGQPTVRFEKFHDRMSRVFASFTRTMSRQLFTKADADKSGELDFQHFKDFIKRRPELLFVAVETMVIRPKLGRKLSILKEAPKPTQDIVVPATN